MILVTYIRLNAVEKEIANAPVIITDLAESGYTAPGAYGHGRLEIDKGGEAIVESLWIIYDRPHESGKVQKVCAQILPENQNTCLLYTSPSPRDRG